MANPTGPSAPPVVAYQTPVHRRYSKFALCAMLFGVLSVPLDVAGIYVISALHIYSFNGGFGDLAVYFFPTAAAFVLNLFALARIAHKNTLRGLVFCAIGIAGRAVGPPAFFVLYVLYAPRC